MLNAPSPPYPQPTQENIFKTKLARALCSTSVYIDTKCGRETKRRFPVSNQARQEGGKGGKFSRAPRRLGGPAVAQKY